MIIIRWVLIVAISWLSLGGGWTSRTAAAEPEPPCEVVSLDKVGQFDEKALQEALSRLAKKNPTHVFVVAHGWNNSRAKAVDSCEKLIREMNIQAGKLNPVPRPFRPGYLAIHWPSLALDGEEDLIELALKQLPPEVKQNIKRVLFFTKFRRESLDKLLDTPLGDNKLAILLFRVFRPFLEEKLGLDRDDAFDPNELTREDTLTILKLARATTFWHMKKRAEIVGGSGGQAVLRAVQAKFPRASVHLIGHSFGCKFWLTALAGEKNPLDRPVESLVLLQGAVSAWAFASEIPLKEGKAQGAYHHIHAESRVRGPIVAVSSKEDVPVRYIYPLASRAAGHIGEQPERSRTEANDLYRGMGSHGIQGVKGVEARPVLASGEKYEFGKGLHSIDATTAVPSHGDVERPAIAWLIWSAALKR